MRNRKLVVFALGGLFLLPVMAWGQSQNPTESPRIPGQSDVKSQELVELARSQRPVSARGVEGGCSVQLPTGDRIPGAFGQPAGDHYRAEARRVKMAEIYGIKENGGGHAE